LAKAKENTRLMIQSAKESSEKVSMEVQQQAKEEAQRILEHARKEIHQWESEFHHRTEERAMDLSLQMLQLTFTDQGKRALQHQLLSEFLEELNRLDDQQMTQTAGKMKVITVAEMSDSERERLNQILTRKMGEKVTFEESVDPEMIAGLIIQIGDFMIDGSLKNQLHKVVLYLRGRSS
jgi:vacuolar-type H+-ATPase subunit H